MPRSVHAYTCYSCGKQDMCGDCIELYCPECERRIRDCHDGKIPSFFRAEVGEDAHPDCPCMECVRIRNDRSIEAKLAGINLDSQKAQ
jgi:hypothetical protein